MRYLLSSCGGHYDFAGRLGHFVLVITRAGEVIRKPTLAWLDRHFPGLFLPDHVREARASRLRAVVWMSGEVFRASGHLAWC